MSETNDTPVVETEAPNTTAAETPEPVESENAIAAAETPERVEPTEPVQHKGDRRFARLSIRQTALEAENAELRKLIPQDRQPVAELPTDPAGIQRLINQRVQETIHADREQQSQRAFEMERGKMLGAGNKQYGAEAFTEACNTVVDMMDQKVPREFVEALLETGNAHGVLFKLSQDPDEIERIAALPLGRQAVALAKIAASVSAPSPTAAASQSKAAAPITPLRTGGGKAEPRPDGTADDYDKWYAKQRSDLRR